jgi:hypothetical protein
MALWTQYGHHRERHGPPMTDGNLDGLAGQVSDKLFSGVFIPSGAPAPVRHTGGTPGGGVSRH